MDALHEIEHEADDKKHQLTNRLAKAFITPIEREDMIDLSHHIDEMTDKIEEVMIRIYMNNVQTIEPGALEDAGRGDLLHGGGLRTAPGIRGISVIPRS